MTEKKSSRVNSAPASKAGKKTVVTLTKESKDNKKVEKTSGKRAKKTGADAKLPSQETFLPAMPHAKSGAPETAAQIPDRPLAVVGPTAGVLSAAAAQLKELKEIMLQVDKELLEILNRKVSLELQFMGLDKTATAASPAGGATAQATAPLPGLVAPGNAPDSPAANPESEPSFLPVGNVDPSLKLGTRTNDWGLDHQRIESIVLLNRSRKGVASETCVRSVFREILGETRRQSHSTRVAYLGPPYSYTHIAALNYFGTSADMVPVSSIAGVFEEVYLRQTNFGVVPLENSTDGRIVDTLDMFTKLPVKISGEIQIPIHHQLLGNIPRDRIRRIYSKPQALSQCRKWLSHHMNGIELKEISSTTAAIEAALEDPQQQSAAIAGLEAAKAYEIGVLAENIEDNPFNMTRFAVLGTEYYPRKGADKTSVMFQLAHTSGSLADALTIFKRNRLNLTWIESFPIPGELNAYLFFVEMEGYVRDLKVRRALAALQKKTIRLEILGSYPKFEGVI